MTTDVGGNYGWAFGYDNIYQVTDANQLFATNRQVDFSYDSVYNRTSWQDTLDSVNVGYDTNAVHQYTAVGATTPTYDSKGNMTSGYGGGYTLTYDEENRLVSAGPYISYTYDLLGRRNSTTCFSTTTVYVWDGDHIIAEYRNGSLIRKYIYGPGVDNPVAMIYVSGGYECWFYYYADALGSIRLITHASGYPVESYTYDVYGQPRVMWGAGNDGNWLTEDVGTGYFSEVGNPYMFTGRWWDWYTSLYYYRARDYSPTLGRFLQPDPIGYADSMNLYAYCLNNPVNWIDPQGLDVYRSNRNFTTDPIKAHPSNRPIYSHTYITLTDVDPVTGREYVTGTYSYGNGGQSAWFPSNSVDLAASDEAFAAGGTREGQARIGGEDLEPYINTAYNAEELHPNEYNVATNNCKDEADELINTARGTKTSSDQAVQQVKKYGK